MTNIKLVNPTALSTKGLFFLKQVRVAFEKMRISISNLDLELVQLVYNDDEQTGDYNYKTGQFHSTGFKIKDIEAPFK